MANTQATDDLPALGTAARATIADCDAKLERYRAALDAGADPAVVIGWIVQTQAERTRVEADLHATQTVRAEADLSAHRGVMGAALVGK
ncbi:hypothetical protein [Micromonospora globispora]|nr:hypothetical protein [Micromonospora globispora]